MGPSGRIPRSLSTSVEGTVKCPDPDQFQDPLTSGTELVTIADGPVGAAEFAIGSNGPRSATEHATRNTIALLDDIRNVALMVDPLVYDGRAWPSRAANPGQRISDGRRLPLLQNTPMAGNWLTSRCQDRDGCVDLNESAN
jgi:hypothetical protein